MLHKSFNRNLHRLIKKIEWPMYLINVDWEKRCSCLNSESNSGDVSCPHCLGIGYKISIRKVLAVKQPYKAGKSSGGDPSSIKLVVSRYYMDAKYGKPSTGDLIIHEKEIDVVKFSRLWRTDSSDRQYYEMQAVSKKYNNDMLLKNFYKIINQK